MFRAVSVFPGPFTLEAAEAVSGAGAGAVVLRLVETTRRHDRAQSRRGGDSRLLLVHRARALRDYYQALAHQALFAGHHAGWSARTSLEIQAGGTDAVAIVAAADRSDGLRGLARTWKIKWDRFIIPKPLARIAIVVGQPVYVPKALDAAGLERLQLDMEQKLRELYREASGLVK